MPICFVAKRSSLFSKDRHPKNVHVSENSDISSIKQSVESTAQISVPFEGKNGSVSTSPSFGSGNEYTDSGTVGSRMTGGKKNPDEDWKAWKS